MRECLHSVAFVFYGLAFLLARLAHNGLLSFLAFTCWFLSGARVLYKLTRGVGHAD